MMVTWHYNDVIMTTIASQITSLTVVYSTVYSDADQRKHQSSASLAFVWGIHRDRWIPRTKGRLRGKCFHLITSSWWWWRGWMYGIVSEVTSDQSACRRHIQLWIMGVHKWMSLLSIMIWKSLPTKHTVLKWLLFFSVTCNLGPLDGPRPCDGEVQRRRDESILGK